MEPPAQIDVVLISIYCVLIKFLTFFFRFLSPLS